MFRFTLTYSGTDTEVTEPKGWSEFKSEIKRDFDSHGVIFKYTSGTLKLGFADGRDILETAFQNDGYDAVVTLTVDKRETINDAWATVYTGTAVMENRELSELYFEVDFETSTFQQKIINRLDMPVDIDSLIDLDGNSLSGTITAHTSTLQSIRLFRYFVAQMFDDDTEYPTEITAVLRSATDASTSSKPQITWFGFGSKKLETLEAVNLDASKIFITNSTYLDEEDAPVPIYIASAGGTVNFSGTLNYDLTITMYHDATANVNTNMYIKIIQYRDGASYDSRTVVFRQDSDVSQAAPSTTHIYDNGSNTGIPDEQAYDEEFTDVLAGDEFYFVIETNGQATAGNNSIESTVYLAHIDNSLLPDPEPTNITISQLPLQYNVTVRNWLIHDVFERVAYIISGNSSGFYSDFFGLTNQGYASDGCGGLNSITTGYCLRQITTKPFIISMRDLLDWASARYGIGWGFEKSGGAYRIRVELMEHFYADAEIMDLGTPIKESGSYVETSSAELSFNRVNIGYKDFFDGVDAKGIQEDFLTESTFSLPVSTIKGDYQKISPIIASNDIIQAGYDRRSTAESWKYDENNFVIALARSGANFVQENNEFFSHVNGLDDVNSAYNIRHAPVYMFLEHALLVNSVLFGKNLTELIQNTAAKINNSFSARGTNYSCLLGDTQQLTRTATGNIQIGDNYEGLRLFKPVKHTFRAALTSAQLDTIIENMEGNGSYNYGYLTYRDNEGAVQTGYPMDIQWNPNDEIAEITTLEKADNYGV